MADNDQLILKIQTYDNPLTERTDDATGKVMLNGSVGMEQLAKDILPVVGDVQYETIISIANRLVDAAVKRLKMGCSVNFGICHARPTVNGSFYGSVPVFDPEVNSIEISISPTQQLRQQMRSTRVQVIGQTIVGPVVNKVLDVKSGELNSTLTPNRNLKIFGVRIQLAGEHPDNGVYLVSAGENETRVKVDPTDIVDNEPSQLTILVPELPASEYFVEVTTQYSSRSATTKAPRTYRLEQVLSVVDKEK